MSSPGWPSAAVALGFLAVITSITMTAIIKYDTTADALEFWAALSGLLGVVTGAFGTYFFSKTAIAAASSAAEAAQTAAQAAESAATAASTQAQATNAALESLRTR